MPRKMLMNEWRFLESIGLHTIRPPYVKYIWHQSIILPTNYACSAMQKVTHARVLAQPLRIIINQNAGDNSSVVNQHLPVDTKLTSSPGRPLTLTMRFTFGFRGQSPWTGASSQMSWESWSGSVWYHPPSHSEDDPRAVGIKDRGCFRDGISRKFSSRSSLAANRPVSQALKMYNKLVS